MIHRLVRFPVPSRDVQRKTAGPSFLTVLPAYADVTTSRFSHAHNRIFLSENVHRWDNPSSSNFHESLWLTGWYSKAPTSEDFWCYKPEITQRSAWKYRNQVLNKGKVERVVICLRLQKVIQWSSLAMCKVQRRTCQIYWKSNEYIYVMMDQSSHLNHNYQKYHVSLFDEMKNPILTWLKHFVRSLESRPTIQSSIEEGSWLTWYHSQ